MMHMAEVYIPKRYKGVRSSRKTQKRVEAQILKDVGGCSTYTVRGRWVGIRGTYTEPVTVIRCYYEEEDHPQVTELYWKRLAEVVKRELHQESAMCVLDDYAHIV